MRRALAMLVLATAGSGCKSTDGTGPAAVSTVVITATLTTIAVGQTTTLSATAFDASGNALTGRTVVWNSLNQIVASVTPTGGVVTGVAAGQVIITATVETKFAQSTITVIAAQASCSGVTPLSVQVGDVHTLTAAERQLLCLAGGTSGSEYVLVPFNSDTSATLSTSRSLELVSTNTSAAVNPPLVASASRSGVAAAAVGALAPTRAFANAFEQQLRRAERTELGPKLRAMKGSPQLRSFNRVPGAPQYIRGLPATPAVGTMVTLNASSATACSNPTNRAARVAAVSNNAIVAVDATAPAGGFSDAEYLSIATTFDTLIFPLDTAAFGAPFDMDSNGRVLLFFTTAVNQLTPLGATGYIGGFFYARDLFPVVATPQVPTACATSNEGEMFYLPVVDPDSIYNKFFKDKARLRTQLNATLAHEFQHLINASRRIYVTVAVVDFEEVWLNEGMSHLAEELLYYHVTGFAPKLDLTIQAVTATQAKLDAINAYQLDNLDRLSRYMRAPDLFSAYTHNDSLQTRGATWELLRYALDLAPNLPNTYTKALVDASTQGIPNFNQAFAGVFSSIVDAVRQQVIAQFFDNAGVAILAKYAFPSWNFRSVLSRPPFSPINIFPLQIKALVQGTTVTFSLTGGGSGYARFRVNAGITAGITPTSNQGAVPNVVELILIRTQ